MTLPIGKAIRHVRETRGVSQRQLSIRAGFPVSYVSKVENEVCRPNLENIFRLCLAMEVEPYKLVKLIARMRLPTPNRV